MVNELEETLRVIRTQKTALQQKLKTEYDRKKMMELANKIRLLSKEENECLRKLGLK